MVLAFYARFAIFQDHMVGDLHQSIHYKFALNTKTKEPAAQAGSR
jgi:hypothetical protein